MAVTSGSMSTNSLYGRVYTFTWNKTSSSETTTTCNWSLSCSGDSGYVAERTVILNVNGQILYNKSDRVERYTGTFAAGTFTISHTNEKNFSASLQVAVYTSSVNLRCSKDWTLPANYTLFTKPTNLQVKKNGVILNNSSIVAPGDTISLHWNKCSNGFNTEIQGFQVFVYYGNSTSITGNYIGSTFLNKLQCTDDPAATGEKEIVLNLDNYMVSQDGTNLKADSQRGKYIRFAVRTYGIITTTKKWTATETVYFPAFKINTLPTVPTYTVQYRTDSTDSWKSLNNADIISSNYDAIRIHSISASDVDGQVLSYYGSINGGDIREFIVDEPIQKPTNVSPTTLEIYAFDGLENGNSTNFSYELHDQSHLIFSVKSKDTYQYGTKKDYYTKQITFDFENEQTSYPITVNPTLDYSIDDESFSHIQLQSFQCKDKYSQTYNLNQIFASVPIFGESKISYKFNFEYKDNIDITTNLIESNKYYISEFSSIKALRDNWLDETISSLPTSISNIDSNGNSLYYYNKFTIQRTINENIELLRAVLQEKNGTQTYPLILKASNSNESGETYDILELDKNYIAQIRQKEIDEKNPIPLILKVTIKNTDEKQYWEKTQEFFSDIQIASAISFNFTITKPELINCFKGEDEINIKLPKFISNKYVFDTVAPKFEYGTEDGIIFNGMVNLNSTDDSYEATILAKNFVPFNNDIRNALGLQYFQGKIEKQLRVKIKNKYGEQFTSNNYENITLNYDQNPEGFKLINDIIYVKTINENGEENYLPFTDNDYLQEQQKLYLKYQGNFYTQGVYNLQGFIERDEVKINYTENTSPKLIVDFDGIKGNNKYVEITEGYIELDNIKELTSNSNRIFSAGALHSTLGLITVSESKTISNVIKHCKATGFNINEITFKEGELNDILTISYSLTDKGYNFIEGLGPNQSNESGLYTLTEKIGNFSENLPTENYTIDIPIVKRDDYPLSLRLNLTSTIIGRAPELGTYNVPIIPLQKSVFTKVYITYANPPVISKRKNMVAINHKLPNTGPIEEGQLKKAILVIDNITDKYEVIYLGYVDNDTVKYRSINIANGTIDDFTLDGGDLNG